MTRQFKKPFQDPEPEQHADSAFIAEQDTLKPPSITLPGAPQRIVPQGYVQGQHGQYGGRSTGQLSSGMGAFGQPGPMPMNTLFAGPQTPRQPGAPLGMPGFAPGMNDMPGPGTISTARPAWGQQFADTRQQNDFGPPEKCGKRGRERRRVPIWARVVIGFLSFLLLLGGSGFWYYQANFAGVVGNVTGKKFVRPPDEQDPSHGKTGSISTWGRVNILLLGSDTDEKSVWGGSSYLAQTVMVVTIDISTHDVGILSIPRDFWIPIPGHVAFNKLDTAFAYGGSINKDMGGVSEVVTTLDKDFGIPISFCAWVGLNGFIKVIDTVGGVDVDVMHPVVDDNYPDDVGTHGKAQDAFKRLYIPDGPQHLDGPTALEYVRSRHSTTDFNRSARQQQVLGALKLKLSNSSILGQLPQIAQDLQGSVYTSLAPDQIFDLVRFARGLDTSKIRHLTLGPPYSHNGQVGSQSVVFPICGAIVPALNQFLHINTAKCNINYNSNGLPQAEVGPIWPAPLATFAQPPAPGNAPQLADVGMFGPGNALSEFFGLRGLLDLMSCVVLDSPQL